MSSAAERRTSIAADCTQSTRRTASPLLCTTKRLCSHSADSSAVPADGKRHAEGCCAPSGCTSIAPAAPACSSRSSAAYRATTQPELELGVLVEQQAEAALRPLEQQAVVRRLALALGQRDHFRRHRVAAGGLHRAVLRGVVEHQDLGLEVQRGAFARDRVQAVAQQSTLLGVDHAERELDGHEGCSLAHRGAWASACQIPDTASTAMASRAADVRSRLAERETQGRHVQCTGVFRRRLSVVALLVVPATAGAEDSVIVKYKSGAAAKSKTAAADRAGLSTVLGAVEATGAQVVQVAATPRPRRPS